METNYRIEPFVRLGETLEARLRDGSAEAVIAKSTEQNPLFTPEAVSGAIRAICEDMLRRETLERWIGRYPRPQGFVPRKIGLVTAGNLPLVGFSDLLCVLVCGHTCLLKPSSKDRVLTRYVVSLIREIDPTLVVRPLDDECPDRLIATGSDTTRLHFESAYPGIPKLLRGSRGSVAVLQGDESIRELEGLADDIFLYSGMGCRSVGRLFVPRDYDLCRLRDILARHGCPSPNYRNGYRQRRALCLMQGLPFTDGGFFLLCERSDDPPAGTIACTRYDRPDEAKRWIDDNDSRLQCIVAAAHTLRHPRRVDFGRAQHPSPEDYPDGVDVMAFLLREDDRPSERTAPATERNPNRP